MRNVLQSTVVCVLAFLLIGAGCAPAGGKPILPGSRHYTPISDWEKQEFDRADRSIYPDDVRGNLSAFQGKTVAWAGIVEEALLRETDEGPEVDYLVSHHYFDWIEDFGLQRERILLSLRGEGLFKTNWKLKKDTPESDLEWMTAPDLMLIVYGEPTSMATNDVITVDASYIRGIEKRWHRTDALDYGRAEQ